jgi:elongation factor G
MEQLIWTDTNNSGRDFERSPIDAAYLPEAQAARDIIIDALSQEDEGILEAFVEERPITAEQLVQAARKATIAQRIVPVFCGAAVRNKGVQPLIDAVVDYLPSPLDLPDTVGRDPANESKTLSRKASEDAPFCALAFKIMSDPFVGTLTYLRVYSGRLEVSAVALNPRTGKRERIGRILQMRANKREDLQVATAGTIVAIPGLRQVATGDTLCDQKHPIVLESMTIPEPVISMAIEPMTKADEEKLGAALTKLAEEDPTFRVQFDKESGQTVISGMGELHLEIIKDRLDREFKVSSQVGRPQVAYRETITAETTHEGAFRRMAAGKMQSASIRLQLSPAESGAGNSVKERISGGIIPRDMVHAAVQGAKETLDRGVLAGFPMVDVRCEILEGTFFEGESTDVAFRVAASMAVQQCAESARPVLLEPIMRVEISAPEEYTGAVLGDLAGRRGLVDRRESRGGLQVVGAEVPLASMFGYATDLRSATQGRASFTMQFEKYADVPANVSQEIIRRYRGY